MIIALPNDGRHLLYAITDLDGRTVHAYRDFDAAIRSREGDQRIFIQNEMDGSWLTGPPTPVARPLANVLSDPTPEMQRVFTQYSVMLDDAAKMDALWMDELDRIRANIVCAARAGQLTLEQTGRLFERAAHIQHDKLKGV